MLSKGFAWQEWRPLRGAGRDREIPARNGLYRVRVAGEGPVLYIGETGQQRGLRGRVGQLAGASHRAGEMPYRDPHTAGPAFWALRHRDSVELEVSVHAFHGTKPERKMLEAMAIAGHRQVHQRSPALNFGRMPRGYRMSSANNRSLRHRGKLFRGGAVDWSSRTQLRPLPSRGWSAPQVSRRPWPLWCWAVSPRASWPAALRWRPLPELSSCRGARWLRCASSFAAGANS